MSKCISCGRELITGDIHWEQGLCNQCWNVYRHEKTPITQYVDMLYKEIYELQNENLKQQLAEKDKQESEIRADERRKVCEEIKWNAGLINEHHNISFGELLGILKQIEEEGK